MTWWCWITLAFICMRSCGRYRIGDAFISHPLALPVAPCRSVTLWTVCTSRSTVTSTTYWRWLCGVDAFISHPLALPVAPCGSITLWTVCTSRSTVTSTTYWRWLCGACWWASTKNWICVNVLECLQVCIFSGFLSHIDSSCWCNEESENFGEHFMLLCWI